MRIFYTMLQYNTGSGNYTDRTATQLSKVFKAVLLYALESQLTLSQIHIGRAAVLRQVVPNSTLHYILWLASN